MDRRMCTMKKGIKIIIVFLLLLVAFYAIYTFYPKNTYSTNPIVDEITINNPEETSRVLKVLLIETDPIITQVAGTELTSGKKASELLGFDKQVALNELIEDLEYTSHGYLTINIYKTEYLNEFPTYTKSYTYPNETKYDSNGNPIDVNYGETITDEVILPDGRTGYRYNEAKYVQNGYNTATKKLDWWQLYRKKYFDGSFSQENSSYSFDYKYIIDKFNLINRRNNGEFDQVWLMGIDSTYSYETIMVGNNPYWTNAPGYIADCPNFLIGGASMSRRDAQFHALGHGVESIMRAAFHRSYSNYTDYTKTGTYKYYRVQYDTYSSDAINISTKEEYDQLNLWEKFNLSDYNNAGTYQSVGTVHHPFNARNGYDYNNSNQVYTNWRDWYDYPSFNNSLQLDNQSAWMNHSINNLLGEGEEKDPDRLYMRMWFYLMPHSTGYTEDGHLNNWWKYFTTLDFVAGLTENDTQSLVVLKGDKLRINLTLNYNSLNTDTITYIKSGNNIQIGNSTILGYTEDGYLYAKKKGNTTVTLNYDGKLITYNVKVVYDNTVTLNGNGATTILSMLLNTVIIPMSLPIAFGPLLPFKS